MELSFNGLLGNQSTPSRKQKNVVPRGCAKLQVPALDPSRSFYKLPELYPHLREAIMENHFGKTTLNTPIRDLNLYLLIIGSLAYCKSSALDYVVTELEPGPLPTKYVKQDIYLKTDSASATANNNELEITNIPGEFLFLAEDDSQYTNSDDMFTTEYGQQIAPMNDSLYNVPETTTDEVDLETVGNENISEFTLEPSTPMSVQDTDLSVWSRELDIPAEYSAEHDATNETDVYEEIFEDIVKYSRNDGAYLGEFNASVVDPFGDLGIFWNEASLIYSSSGSGVRCVRVVLPSRVASFTGAILMRIGRLPLVSFTSSVLKPFFPVMDTSQMISGNFLTKIAADYMYWRNETKYQVSLKSMRLGVSSSLSEGTSSTKLS
uniref:Uncharacterized protein n=1 Tax=Timema monikensis TaxID=170555 RepID=A0A7R9HJT0_9NEOP|nr:unnamed protein product [Timema monikensis]